MKNYLLAGCSVWLMGIAAAQPPAAHKAAVAATQPAPAENIATADAGHTLLWEISGNGLPQASFLFGTMHLLCAEDARISANLKDIIRQSAAIYFEIDLDNMPEMMGALKYIKMNGNQQLHNLLTPEEYIKIQAYFEKHPGMFPLQVMESFKPYFITSMISEEKMTCAAKGGMEQAIMQEAKQYHKEIKGLETIAFQASVFDSIPYAQQAKELVKYIDSADQNTREAEELVAVYKQQDLGKIEVLTSKEEDGVADFINLLLYNRNADWINKMNRIMPASGVLFAVGAGHLPGEKGVIALLRENGYSVKPVANVW